MPEPVLNALNEQVARSGGIDELRKRQHVSDGHLLIASGVDHEHGHGQGPDGEYQCAIWLTADGCAVKRATSAFRAASSDDPGAPGRADYS